MHCMRWRWNGDDPLSMLRTRRSSAFYADFDIAALELKLGDVLFDEELDEFFEFFLVHL